MSTSKIRIDDRYQGFPDIAQGGFTGGLMARRIGPEAEVVLHRPIRTCTELRMVEVDDGVELIADDEVAAKARETVIDIDVPEPVSWEAAKAAEHDYLGHHEHPYPSCFCCGTERAVGDGLRIFAGPLDDSSILAATWQPHSNHAEDDDILPSEYVWAAMDCPSIWAVMEAAPPTSPDHVVTGKLAVRIERPIQAGNPHVVMAWTLPPRSRTRPAAAAILDRAGAVKAVARHTLVVTDWGVPLGVSRVSNSR